MVKTPSYEPIPFEITPQPDEATCGPSSLHAIYRYYGHCPSLDRVIEEVQQFPEGGTLAVWLGLHALRSGYRAIMYTFNLQLFDPTWFNHGPHVLLDGLEAQRLAKDDPKLHASSEAYLEFISAGGDLRMEDLSPALLQRLLVDGPIIVGLSATWLYQSARERRSDMEPDDIAGEPLGHFLVVYGLDIAKGLAQVADPYLHKPFPGSHHYAVGIDRLICAILLGVVTYDGKLLLITPDRNTSNLSHANPADRQ